MREVLGAVADAQQRQFALEEGQVHLRGVGVPHGAGASGQDHALDAVIQGRDLVVRIDLTIDVQLPQAAADELRDLGAEVEDQNPIHRGSSWGFPW